MSKCQRKKLTQYFLPVLITAHVNIVINPIELMRRHKNRSSRQRLANKPSRVTSDKTVDALHFGQF